MQVTVEYKKEGGAVVPVRVHTILISTQHSPDVSNETIHKVRGGGGKGGPGTLCVER